MRIAGPDTSRRRGSSCRAPVANCRLDSFLTPLREDNPQATPNIHRLPNDAFDLAFAKREKSPVSAGIMWIAKHRHKPLDRVAQLCELLGEGISHVQIGGFGGGDFHADQHGRIGWIGVIVWHECLPSSTIPA